MALLNVQKILEKEAPHLVDQNEWREMSAIVEARSAVTATLTEAQKKLNIASRGGLSRTKRYEEFRDFLNECRAANHDHTSVMACAKAYEQVMLSADDKSPWELAADAVPPAVLLLFLLATLSALYRYNVRLAGFYHARADGLLLMNEEFTEVRFDKLANTLAADQVEFKGTKTPVDAVTDITKTVLSKIKQ